MTGRARCVVVLAAAVAAIAFSASAASAAEKVTDCESWNGGRELRCLSQGAGASIGGVVTLYNPDDSTITFSTQIRKGVCNLASNDASARQDHALPPEAGEDVPLDPHYIGPGLNSACTELLVFDCKHSGIKRFCKGTVLALLKEQDSWPPGPPRDCEIWDDGKINCVSWSLKQGAPHEPGSVALSRLSSSGPVLTIELHEYQSTCGSVRTFKADPSAMELDPGESGVYRLGSYQGDFAPVSDLCVGLLITQCHVGDAWVKCIDHLRATMQ